MHGGAERRPVFGIASTEAPKPLWLNALPAGRGTLALLLGNWSHPLRTIAIAHNIRNCAAAISLVRCGPECHRHPFPKFANTSRYVVMSHHP